MKSFQNIRRGVLALTGAVLLSACTGESDNLPDPIVGPVTECKALAGTTCIPGRFIADAVENLDYECGKVKARTGIDGSFSCPEGSEVTFSLLNPDDLAEDARKIVLGKAVARRPAYVCTPSTQNNNCSGPPPMYLYLTPADIASTEEAQLNIVRLLQALSSDNDTTIPAHSPSRRVVLSQEDKKKLSLLEQSITAADFGRPVSVTLPGDPGYPDAASFDNLVLPFLDALGDQLISKADASLVLTRAINATVAGIYVTPNTIGGFCDGSAACNDAGLTGSTGSTAADTRLIGAMWGLVDRKGRLSGVGVYAQEQGNQNITLFSDPKPMILSLGNLVPSGLGSVPLWPRSGDLTGLAMELRTASGTSAGKTLTLTQGLMKQGAVAGTRDGYNNLFKNYPDNNPNPLGWWQLVENGSGKICPEGSITPCVSNPAHKATYSLIHIPAVAPTLDPDLWVNFQSNPLLPTINFPLNIKAEFLNSRKNSAGDYVRESLGTIYFSILEDGNIVTNRNYNPSDPVKECNVDINPDTLVDDKGFQEYPIGTVMSISRTSSTDFPGSEVFITPLFMLPEVYGGAYPKLPGIQAFSNTEGGSFAIKVKPSSSSEHLKSYSVEVVSQDTVVNGVTCSNPEGCAWFKEDGLWDHKWRTSRYAWACNSESGGTGTCSNPVTLQLGYDMTGIVQTTPAEGCPL